MSHGLNDNKLKSESESDIRKTDRKLNKPALENRSKLLGRHKTTLSARKEKKHLYNESSMMFMDQAWVAGSNPRPAVCRASTTSTLGTIKCSPLLQCHGWVQVREEVSLRLELFSQMLIPD